MAKRRWRRSRVSPNSTRLSWPRLSDRGGGSSFSICCATSAEPLSFHLVDVKPHGALLPLSFGDRQDPVKPVDRRGCSLEAHHCAEIIVTRVDILAPRQFFHHLGRPVPQTFTIDHDEGPGVGLDAVARLYVGNPIAADELPISAAGQNSTRKPGAANGATQNADHAPLAIWCLAEAGDGVEFGVDGENRLFAQHDCAIRWSSNLWRDRHLTLPMGGRKYGIPIGIFRMARISSLAEAIKSAVRDGDTIALEGFTHLIPHAAGHEIIRQGRKGLTLIRMTPDLIYDQLIGMGCVSKLVFSWGGNPGVGSLHRLRDAIENGWPQKLELEEHSLAAIPAHRPDVAVIHAQRADKAGNVMIEGVLGVQKEAVLASKRSVVTVEEIVDDLPERSLNAVVLPHWTVGHVVEVPGGAFPSYAQGYYPRNNNFYKEWDAISRERDSFLAWIKENVLTKGPEVFAKYARKHRMAAE